MQEAVELHLEGLREEEYPVPEPSTSSAYTEITAWRIPLTADRY
jgi:predicted RNase H-like HicB family nuclease